jgi:hypothetical protein
MKIYIIISALVGCPVSEMDGVTEGRRRLQNETP